MTLNAVITVYSRQLRPRHPSQRLVSIHLFACHIKILTGSENTIADQTLVARSYGYNAQWRIKRPPDYLEPAN